MNLKSFKIFMRFLALCFLIVGLFFVVKPHATLGIINYFSLALGFLQEIPLNVEYFWLSLAGSLMMTLSYLCYQAVKISLNHVAIQAVLVAKLASSVFFVMAACRTTNSAYLIGAIVDMSIFLAILFCYKKVR